MMTVTAAKESRQRIAASPIGICRFTGVTKSAMIASPKHIAAIAPAGSDNPGVATTIVGTSTAFEAISCALSDTVGVGAVRSNTVLIQVNEVAMPPITQHRMISIMGARFCATSGEVFKAFANHGPIARASRSKIAESPSQLVVLSSVSLPVLSILNREFDSIPSLPGNGTPLISLTSLARPLTC